MGLLQLPAPGVARLRPAPALAGRSAGLRRAAERNTVAAKKLRDILVFVKPPSHFRVRILYRFPKRRAGQRPGPSWRPWRTFRTFKWEYYSILLLSVSFESTTEMKPHAYECSASAPEPPYTLPKPNG